MSQGGVRKWLVGFCLPGVVAGVALVPVSQAGASPAPTLTVSPAKNLADLQLVTVAGKGFTPSITIGTVECVSTATDESGCDLETLVETQDSATGAFTLKRDVRRIINPPSGKIDCASKPGACAMAGANVTNITEHAGALISFNPKIPPATPKITTTPSTGLRDHQIVQVAGSGMAPNSYVQILQCQTGSTPSYSTCDPSSSREVEVGPDGKFTTSWAVHRVLDFQQISPTPETLDCATRRGACEAVASQSLGSTTSSATDPLSFNPAIPPVRQRVAVAPTAGLVDHQLVQIEGGGFTAGAPVSVEQCQAATSSTPLLCDYTGSVSVAAGFIGHFHLVYPVERMLQVGGTSFDCASKANACLLLASDQQRQSEVAQQGLSFDSSVPPVVISMSVTPHTGLFDDELVTVFGKGFVPFSSIGIFQCTSASSTDPFPTGLCSNGFGVQTTANRAGAFTASVFVHRVFGTYSGPIGCATKPGDCVIAAFRTNGFPLPEGSTVAAVPLTFRK